MHLHKSRLSKKQTLTRISTFLAIRESITVLCGQMDLHTFGPTIITPPP